MPATMMLRLPLKREFFDAIQAGTKAEEYRLRNLYWRRRIEDRTFDGIWLTLGYPKVGDTDKWIERPWLGYTIKRIRHPHFGPHTVEVFAIPVNSAQQGTKTP